MGMMQSSQPLALRLPNRGDYPITPSGLRIGRSPDSNVCLRDDQASRRHALVWAYGGQAYIRDEGSTNGTLVNGRRISEPHRLRSGDTVAVGRHTLVVIAAASNMAMPAQRLAHGRTTGSPADSRLAILLVFGLIAILAVLFALSVSGPSDPGIVAAGTSPAAKSNPIEHALAASVRIVVPVDGGASSVLGSGSIVSRSGYVLTNLHVVADKTGAIYNRQGVIRIGVVGQNSNGIPQDKYLAELVAYDASLDLALLRVHMLVGGRSLPADLALTAVPIGDSDRLSPGDDLIIIGFPGMSDTATTTRGIVSGFEAEGPLVRAWIKTDTEVNRGNSGGIAINDAGELVGVPSRVVADRVITGKIGYVRPVNLAKSLLARGK